ncbi:PVC-type heme-binding CxxCH protein [Bremerella volcania]|uniref:PVC-type heme-binding CxxCH protein n=1 Tax=Bremerella volcania TaxID=2527984 RepID=UPI0013FCFD70|nr:PVC-type heme-binding CxxCH protein [Bremerella volcania]
MPSVPPRAAAEALQTFQVADGFRIELAAAEPSVVDPVAMAFDADGRLFVIEMRGYSEDDSDMLGRVRLLEDVNDDGIYEKSTIFAEGFSWPTAICCTRKGILVGAAPDIIWLKDTDGDGKADERQAVFTGFNKSNVQGLLNTFQWGLDNRIHGVTSSSGGNVQRVVDGKPTGKPISLRGRDFSIDPRTMEMIAISGGGQHGMSMNSWGEKFTCSNSDHLQQILFEDRYLARNPYLSIPSVRRSIAQDGPQAEVYRTSPVEAWRVIRTKLRAAKIVPGIVEGGGRPAGYFTGATGVTIFRGDAWPKRFQGLAIIGDVGSNLIHRKRLVEHGVAYQGIRIDESEEFVSSSDIWFRPVQYANAPDGSLYVADMYREVIEHPKSLPPMIKKHLDLTSGRDRGRIYRIVVNDYQRRSTPRMTAMNTLELVSLLNHPNSWHRETAARLIYERQDNTVVSQIERSVTKASLPEGRVISLSALSGLKKLSPGVLLAAMHDEHPRVRQHAIRLAEPLLEKSPELRQQIANLAGDSTVHVRFQVALSAGYLPDEVKVSVLKQLARSDGENPDFQAAIQSSLRTNAGRLLAELALDDSAPKELLSLLARQIGKQQRPDDIANVAKLLPKLNSDQPKVFQFVITHLAIPPGSSLAQQMAKATNGESEEVINKMVARAKATLKNRDAPIADRIRAVDVLQYGPFDPTTFGKLLEPSQPLALQEAALKEMQGFTEPEVAELLVSRWPNMAPGVRTKASGILTSRATWVGVLLDAIDNETIPTSDVDGSQLVELKPILSEQQGRRIDSLLNRPSHSDRAAIITAYRSSLTMDGEKERGQKVFNKHCTACHQFNGEGHPIGPNLAAMKNRGAEAILVNILNPNAEVNPQYLNYICLTNDGRTISGVITNETATSITLVQADNKSETILRIDIEQLKSTGVSLMPEGLEKVIDQQAMSDLLNYITQSE